MTRITRALSYVAVLALGGVLTAAAGTGRFMPSALPLKHLASSSGVLSRAFGASAPAATDARTLAEIRRRIRAGAAGTYIGEILGERDSALARWPEQRDQPLSVWIQPTSRLGGFDTAYVGRVRDAFATWGEVNFPVRFRFTRDSAAAQVHVSWIDHFDEEISGQTNWERDDHWMITDGDIRLALHHHEGDSLVGDAMEAMALHEIGHLLGLDHTTDSLSIMAPTVRVRELSAADRATVRLLYSIPPGPLAQR